jgi:hypothetical protein
MAMFCAAGHAIAGWRIFYQPMRSAIADPIHACVLAGM